jgi:hypothetical protein
LSGFFRRNGEGAQVVAALHAFLAEDAGQPARVFKTGIA